MISRIAIPVLLLFAGGAWAQPSEKASETDLPQLEAQLEAAQAQLEAATEQLRSTDLESLRQAELAEDETELAEERARVRESLQRTRRELQRASRDLARAHRAIEREHHQAIHIGTHADRGVIGVLLGERTDAGVRIAGVTPNGPAEKAGLREQDLLVAINGQRLDEKEDPMQTLRAAMAEVKPDDSVSLTVDRDGDELQFEVEAAQRRPLRMAFIPDVPLPPDVEFDIDVEEIEQLVEEIRLRSEEAIPRIQRSIAFALNNEDGEIELESLSRLGQNALQDVSLWFGPDLIRGLSLTDVNPQLGQYFGVESGVLVLEAKDDNLWGLQSGDVITAVEGSPVDQAGDLMRNVRDTDVGQPITITILRSGSEQSLTATVPEDRKMGLRPLMHGAPPAPQPAHPEQPGSAPAAPLVLPAPPALKAII